MHRLDRWKDAARLDESGRRSVHDLTHEHLQAAEGPDAKHRGDARDPTRAKNEDGEPSGPILLGLLVR
jgi:hypothetical protein